MDDSIILYLIIATFGAVVLYAVVQLLKTRKAKQTDKHSAMADARNEPR